MGTDSKYGKNVDNFRLLFSYRNDKIIFKVMSNRITLTWQDMKI